MTKKILFAITFILATACNSSTSESKAEETTTSASAPKEAKPDFSNIQFASLKDTSCGMPLSAGVGDTAIVDGKVYGLPLSMEGFGYIYNKDIFAEVGIDPLPKTMFLAPSSDRMLPII